MWLPSKVLKFQSNSLSREYLYLRIDSLSVGEIGFNPTPYQGSIYTKELKMRSYKIKSFNPTPYQGSIYTQGEFF